MSPRKAVNGQDSRPGVVCRGKRGQVGQSLGFCAACLKPLPPGAGARYCSGRCRLRGWALRDLAKAIHDGTAGGLRAGISELAKSAKATGT